MRFINPFRLFQGAMIPNWLMRRTEIGFGAKICYARMCQYAGRDGQAWPNQDTLADELGCGVRNAQYLLKELAENRLLLAVRQGNGQPNKYRFLYHPWMDAQDSAHQLEIDTQDFAPADMQDSAPAIHEENQLKRISKKTPIKTLAAATVSDLMPWITEKRKEGISFAAINIAMELEKCKNHFLGKNKTIGTARNWLLNSIKYATPAAQSPAPARPQPAPSRGSTVVGSPEWEALQREAGLL